MAYTIPPTNARRLNPISQVTQAITDPMTLLLFSTVADANAMLALAKQIDPNAALADNPMGLPVIYGDDGRKINVLVGTVNGAAYMDAVGVLIAQKNFGPAWNEGRLPPYNKLVFDTEGFDTADGQFDWTA